MRTATSGNPGEAAVLAAFVSRGYDVFVPFGGGHAFDLAIHLGGADFLRVQCKTGWREKGCVLFNCLTTDHGSGARSYDGLADVFGVYFPPAAAVYLVPLDCVGRSEGRLRLEPALNNQRKRTRLAADYELEGWTDRALRALARSTDERITAVSAA
jgi:hypothetical protein